MAAPYTGTITIAGKNGVLGHQLVCRGDASWDANLAATNKFNFTNLLPKGNFKVVAFRMTTSCGDSHATAPLLSFQAGDATDPDGYLTTTVQMAALSTNQVSYFGNGAYITGQTASGLKRSVVVEVVAAPQTAVSTGTLSVEFIIEAV
jgi:hypothetical protein